MPLKLIGQPAGKCLREQDLRYRGWSQDHYSVTTVLVATVIPPDAGCAEGSDQGVVQTVVYDHPLPVAAHMVAELLDVDHEDGPGHRQFLLHHMTSRRTQMGRPPLPEIKPNPAAARVHITFATSAVCGEGRQQHVAGARGGTS
jgi:hypothetical protein